MDAGDRPVARVTRAFNASSMVLVFTFLNVLITNPSISGYSVVDHDNGAERFTNMSSLLVIIFAFFALFLFIITRRLADKRKK